MIQVVKSFCAEIWTKQIRTNYWHKKDTWILLYISVVKKKRSFFMSAKNKSNVVGLKVFNCRKPNEIYSSFLLRKLRMKIVSLHIETRTGVLLTMIDFFRIIFTIHYFNEKVLESSVMIVRVKDPIEIKTHFSLLQ